ncbi:MAG: DEAD/DEAH box helicase, partial [Bacteroidota bacterium]
MASFEDLKLTRQFINAVEELGFTQPTEVQQKCILPVLSGQQVIGVAPTGTGKTAAYGLPLLQLLKYAQGDNPRVLVVVPTKELVLQVEEKLRQLAKYTDLRIFGIYGGIGPKAQIDEIAKGVDIIVATPGRFLEIYLRGKLVVKQVKHLVLDEADKIMDMGFMPQLRNILEVLPRKRQNLLFSATFGPKVDQLSEEFLEFPLKIEVSPSATTLKQVSQVKIAVPNLITKLNYLKFLLADPEMERVIVFAKKRESATAIFNTLEKGNFGEIRVIHANKGQNFRINSYKEFQEGNVRILVATDVAARGIDIVDVSHVVNFDVPMRYE